MRKLTDIFSQQWKINFLLLVCSFGIYFYYFHHLFLNLNSVLSTSNGDTIKNYYTYIYHIKYDEFLLHFSGMSFPFGEHVVYTDCQPLLTFILRLLPFTHDYLIGIAHGLIILSLLITPLILYAIFSRLGVDKFSGFFISLGIAILSPQIRRLDGHFALSYECMIPLTILLLLKFFQENNQRKTIVLLFTYNCALFFIHPYLGFGNSVLCFFSMFIFLFLTFNKSTFLRNLSVAVIVGILPIFFFKFFMLVTDLHGARTVEPDGIRMLIANVASVFVPNFGPFEEILKKTVSDAPQDYEGLSYVGIFMDFLIIAFIVLIPFYARKISLKKETFSLLFSALILLLFSFGIHNQLLDYFHLNISLFNQFRTLGRFAWFFYYALPIFLIPVLYNSFKKAPSHKYFNKTAKFLSVLFFSINLIEANSLLGLYSGTLFKDRNFFRTEFLTNSEKENIQNIQKNKPQAIITLPTFYIGSEVYSRQGGDYSMIPAIMYSYHLAIPICGTFLSRTSIPETEAGIELLNSYKRTRKVDSLLSPAPFLVITANQSLFPDEERLQKKVTEFRKDDSLKFGYVSKADLLRPFINKNIVYVYKNRTENDDSSDVIFIHHENRKPFLPSIISDHETAYSLDSNKIRSGNYIVSLHFHYTEKTFRGVFNHLVVDKINHEGSGWEWIKAIRLFSGFYPGFAVFEYPVELKRENKYDFFLYGFGDKTYTISDFMIRPDTTDVRVLNNGKDTTINNFPIF